MNDRTDYLTWMLFFVAGGLAGAGGALLFAPESGRDTRGRMGRSLRRAGRSARDLGERAIRRGDQIRGKAARKLEEAATVLAGNGGESSPPSGSAAHPR